MLWPGLFVTSTHLHTPLLNCKESRHKWDTIGARSKIEAPMWPRMAKKKSKEYTMTTMGENRSAKRRSYAARVLGALPPVETGADDIGMSPPITSTHLYRAVFYSRKSPHTSTCMHVKLGHDWGTIS